MLITGDSVQNPPAGLQLLPPAFPPQPLLAAQPFIESYGLQLIHDPRAGLHQTKLGDQLLVPSHIYRAGNGSRTVRDRLCQVFGKATALTCE